VLSADEHLAPRTTLAEHLAVSLDPHLPAALIAEPYLARIHAVGQALPSALSEFFGFECRLGDERPAADFLVCVKAEEGGRAVLAGAAAVELPPILLSDTVWSRLRRFAERWAEADSLFDRHVRNLWLEFDLETPPAGAPIPSVFFGTESLRAGASGVPEWLGETLTTLRGGAPSPKLVTSIERALAALPEGAWVFQVGSMLARPVDMVRLCIRGLSASGTLQYLSALGWPGLPAEAEALVGEAFARSDSVDLDIDLLPEMGPKIGLECSFADAVPARHRLPPFVDWLVEQGVCRAAKGRGLLSWTRGFHERQQPEAWPADLRQESRERGPVAVSMFLRWPYHIKLVHNPGHALEAKAYLAVKRFWPTRENLDRIRAAMEASARGTTP
jgi:hypothetical protein